MNSINYSDPFGLATINLFIGEGMTEKKAAKHCYGNSKNRVCYPYDYPDWKNLKDLAQINGHTLNLFEKIGNNKWKNWYKINNNYFGKLKVNQHINSIDVKDMFEK